MGNRPGWALWWGLAWLVAAAGLSYAAWQLFGHTPYRIDIDVYQMGAQAWMDGHPLYRGDALFHTPIVDLPFTYPPLAAIVFCPFAWMHMPTASVAITALTLVLLVVSTVIVLTRLDVWSASTTLPGPAWLRRWWLAIVAAAAATIWLEPISSNFAFGQINVVLMTLVIADCVPRRTPWPRGLLLGLGMALKLTPAVFLLYFVLRRDNRAALTALASFVGATLLGFVLAWNDSWEYWTHTVHHTDRIGAATLNTDQNIAGALARLGLGQQERSLLWVAASLLVLAVTVWAMRRVLRAGRAHACAGVRRVVRVGGVAGVLVAPLGMGAADGAGDGDPGLAAPQRGPDGGQRHRGGADAVVADRPAAQASRGQRGLVASAGRYVLRVVGAGGHRHGRDHRHRPRGCAGCGPATVDAGYRRRLTGRGLGNPHGLIVGPVVATALF